ncbi:hypothetical protein SAMD00019534_077780 [Acytostelium subglobosum LB1]|uniref:hypothetical protein n=1 Tax=Acytostelium subglobosum LB1 TaxID=1410327 RepID=UPI000644C424|nr:hypothetical protein SAMD00019534_077780 [Acytostelium subglobosum LB1]GAM24603.1 hypothetical protein SAMD00019534_077780 [Acytostelium subglobosum LB1]|eukprot:XP_012752272.1 hypothetical protein SAMD00019534_077780 [Acytostelium subglobosum LB1]
MSVFKHRRYERADNDDKKKPLYDDFYLTNSNTVDKQCATFTNLHITSSPNLTSSLHSSVPPFSTTEDDRRKMGLHRSDEEWRRRVDNSKIKEEERIKREKAAAAQLILEEKQRKEMEQLNNEREIEQLDKTDITPIQAHHPSNLYSFFPDSVYQAFHQLQMFTRDLPVPEFVFVGPKGAGKSALIEALVGLPLNLAGLENVYTSTKRPIHIQFQYNHECQKPRITLKTDTQSIILLPNFDQLGIHLSNSNSNTLSSSTSILEPISITIESNKTLTFTLIDTPGLQVQSGNIQERVETLIHSLISRYNRTIIAVDTCGCGDWNKMASLPIISQVDPHHQRTSFVLTNLNKLTSTIHGFSASQDINRFLAGAPQTTGSHSYYATLPNQAIRIKSSDVSTLQKKVFQLHQRDVNTMEQLQFDQTYIQRIGMLAFRSHFINLIWKYYQSSVPSILKDIQQCIQNTTGLVQTLQDKHSRMDISSLRKEATNSTATLLQTIERLLTGTSEGNPTLNGQTLFEERQQAQATVESSISGEACPQWSIEEYVVPNSNVKLFGGQQFERLMSEFKLVTETTRMPGLTTNEIATSCGFNKLNSSPNHVWAACDLAQQKSYECMLPLIDELAQRAIYVMKHLWEISHRVMGARRKNTCLGSSTDMPETTTTAAAQYPYFAHHIKETFDAFVQRAASQCREKCMDEFMSTRAIYWEFTEYQDQGAAIHMGDNEYTRSHVEYLTERIFESIRKRLTKNVILRFYNFFLVPMQTDLWSVVQGRINSLTDDTLAQLFELDTNKSMLAQESARQTAILSRYKQRREEFRQAAAQFSHPCSSSSCPSPLSSSSSSSGTAMQ